MRRMILLGLLISSSTSAAPLTMSTIRDRISVAAPAERTKVMESVLEEMTKRIDELGKSPTYQPERADLLVTRMHYEPLVDLAKDKPTKEQCQSVAHDLRYGNGSGKDEAESPILVDGLFIIKLFCPDLADDQAG
jgi:hypothetical protein